MRIAISGTHCSGKTTLIEAFLNAHPDFAHEPEPYAVMLEDYGEDFAAEPSADEFIRQLEFNVDRLRRYQSRDRVIFERSPADFLAYILALKDLRRDDDSRLLEVARGLASQATRYLDLIVFLPLDDTDPIEPPDSEDPRLRRAVDRRLVAIFGDDELNLGRTGAPVLLEVRGATEQRLRTLEQAVDLGI